MDAATLFVHHHTPHTVSLTPTPTPTPPHPPPPFPNQFKASLASLRLALQKANDASARSELMTGRATVVAAETAARDRMAGATESSVRGTVKLAQAQSLLVETQDIGVSVIDSMEQQRESILRSTEKVGGGGVVGGWFCACLPPAAC